MFVFLLPLGDLSFRTQHHTQRFEQRLRLGQQLLRRKLQHPETQCAQILRALGASLEDAVVCDLNDDLALDEQFRLDSWGHVRAWNCGKACAKDKSAG